MKHYGKIFSVGDPSLKEYGLFDSPVSVEEKVDGSQFRFGVEGGVPFFGSKRVIWDLEHPVDKMFNLAYEQAERIINLEKNNRGNDWFAVCEYLPRPKSNALEYARTPANHLVLLDFWEEGKGWSESIKVREELARAWGIECVPELYFGELKDADGVRELLKRESFLGKAIVEGVVIKNRSKRMVWGGKEQSVMGKFVREEFKELNKEKWGAGKTLGEKFEAVFPKQARWDKAIQHLRDDGVLKNKPEDLALLMPELNKDIGLECKEVAKQFLWNEYKHQLLSRLTSGFPQYYKDKLLEQGFKE